MATSFAQDVGTPEAPVSISPGIVDESAAQAITAIGSTALDLFRGKATAELVGAAAESDEVTDQDLPEHITDDLNLSQLTAARRAGMLSQSEFITRVNANQRRVIAKYPAFAETIRKRTETFYSGGLDRGALFGKDQKTEADIFNDTLTREQAKIAARDADLSRQLGVPVEQVKQIQGRVFMNDYVADTLRLDTLSKKVTTSQARQRLQGQLKNKQIELLTELVQNTNEGGLLPEARVAMKSKIRLTYSELRRSAVEGLAPGADPSSIIEDIGREEEAALSLIDDGSMENLIKSKKDIMANLLATNSMSSFSAIYQANLAGGQRAVDALLDATNKPELTDQILKDNPVASAFHQAGDYGKYVHGLLFGETPVGQMAPRDKVAVGQLGVNELTSPPRPSSKGDVPISVQKMRELVNDDTTVTSGRSWLHPSARSKINNDPAYADEFRNYVNSLTAAVVTDFLASDGASISGVRSVGGRIEFNTSGDAPGTKLRLLQELVGAYPHIVTSPGTAPAAALQEVSDKINKQLGQVRGTTSQAPTPAGGAPDIIYYLDDEGNLIGQQPREGALATPTGEVATTESGPLENVRAWRSSGVRQAIQKAVETYQTSDIDPSEINNVADLIMLGEGASLNQLLAVTTNPEEVYRMFEETNRAYQEQNPDAQIKPLPKVRF